VKRLFDVFVLTPAEQRLIIFVVLLLVAGAWYKHHRDLNYSAALSPAATPTPIVSSSPGEN
jgi:protein involved in temperature-dependent protein secretion